MELTSSQPIPTTASPPMTRGLTEAEAVQRRAAGKGNNIRLETSRTYWQIIRDNIFTFLNMVLFSIGAVLVLLGLPTDAFLSVGIALLNVVVGVVQEFRAKRLLDKIALLTRPKATVLRDTVEKVVDPNQIVLGDWLIVHPGDQIVVDGRLVEGKVDVDESLLTGESDLIPKQVGDTLYSGSFVVNGSATFEAEKVGAESFANQLTASARTLKLVKTPLQMDVDMVVRLLVLLSVQLGILFGMAMIIDGVEATESARQAAVIVGLIPNGLFFMVTIAYAMGTVRMAGKGALIQQSNAVESMSNVNVLCLDKTGTLTANRIGLHQVQPFILSESEFRRVLGIYAHSGTTGNRTSEALALACPGESRPFVEEVPFSSARKWSALSFDQPDMQGVYVLGAPEMLRPYLNEQQADFGAEMSRWIEHGYRVLLLAQYPEVTPLHDSLGQPQLPPDLIPVGILSFSDELRAEAESTLKGFSEAGIRLKIISGDNPQTVLALAKQAGLRGDIKAVSGLDLEEMTEAQLGDVAEQSTIFGRITPHQKERLVDALKRRGHYVAMIGDGVNDVLSLKKAHIGIAMQSGTQAARGVADIILMNDSFAAHERLVRGAAPGFPGRPAHRQRDAGHHAAVPGAGAVPDHDYRRGSHHWAGLPGIAGASIAALTADGRHPDAVPGGLGATSDTALPPAEIRHALCHPGGVHAGAAGAGLLLDLYPVPPAGDCSRRGSIDGADGAEHTDGLRRADADPVRRTTDSFLDGWRRSGWGYAPGGADDHHGADLRGDLAGAGAAGILPAPHPAAGRLRGDCRGADAVGAAATLDVAGEDLHALPAAGEQRVLGQFVVAAAAAAVSDASPLITLP